MGEGLTGGNLVDAGRAGGPVLKLYLQSSAIFLLKFRILIWGHDEDDEGG